MCKHQHVPRNPKHLWNFSKLIISFEEQRLRLSQYHSVSLQYQFNQQLSNVPTSQDVLVWILRYHGDSSDSIGRFLWTEPRRGLFWDSLAHPLLRYQLLVSHLRWFRQISSLQAMMLLIRRCFNYLFSVCGIWHLSCRRFHERGCYTDSGEPTGSLGQIFRWNFIIQIWAISQSWEPSILFPTRAFSLREPSNRGEDDQWHLDAKWKSKNNWWWRAGRYQSKRAIMSQKC